MQCGIPHKLAPIVLEVGNDLQHELDPWLDISVLGASLLRQRGCHLLQCQRIGGAHLRAAALQQREQQLHVQRVQRVRKPPCGVDNDYNESKEKKKKKKKKKKKERKKEEERKKERKKKERKKRQKE